MDSRSLNEKISIIIPVYNQAEKIKKCLESLLIQEKKPDEVIIINDGSSDDSFEAAQSKKTDFERLGIRYLVESQKNMGAPHARNRGLALSSGEFVLFCDADAVLEKDALRIMNECLFRDTLASYAYSSFMWGNKLFKCGPFDPIRLKREPYIHTMALIRRKDLKENPWDESISKFQDWDLWLAMLESGHKGTWIDKALFKVSPGGSMSEWLPAFAYDFLPMLKVVKKYKRSMALIKEKHGLKEESKVNDVKYYFWMIVGLFAAECLSFISYSFPLANTVTFFLILALVAILALKDLKFALLAVLIELFISSKGYLFYFSNGETLISLRIALWMVFLSAFIISIARKREIFIFLKFLKGTLFPYFVILAFFVVFSALNGFLNNSFSDLFFDLNGWLYFLLALPAYYLIGFKKINLKPIHMIFIASAIWISIKTLFLEFIFSHWIFFQVEPVYRWIRQSGIGEITFMESGFTRIFFQSHIFVLFAFFIILAYFNEKQKLGGQNKYPIFFLLTIFASVVIISLSRSFWLGSLVSMIIFLFALIKNHGWKYFLKSSSMLLATFIFSFLLIAVIIKFPYPRPGDIELAKALKDRASQLSNEAAVSSRYKLWPVLAKEIKSSPIFGHGFGKALTYESSDPRVLETTADGLHTTYAFEWGWLDIWLKIGILGTLSYLAVIILATKKSLANKYWLFDGLAICLILISLVNFFTPYLNHPLGIGFLIVSACLIDRGRSCQAF